MKNIMKGKIIVILMSLILIFVAMLTFGTTIASTSGDEHYNDHSREYAQGEQPDPEEIPGMNRAEDRTRNKDL